MEPDEVETWKRALLRFRAQKEEFMRLGHDSPFVSSGQHDFQGLRYFEPDPAFRFEAKLQRYRNEPSAMMTTSKGTRQLFNKAGRFDLEVEGQPVPLQAYQSAEREDLDLFIPFKDATSGKETYGAARYLDMRVEHDDNYLVDFNYAYNPYCAYSEGYVCPLPPAENWLRAAVRAGEKKYHE
ncbi:MAG TPA: DUF1684 domain-containing protein [Nitrososphaerales archaeon]|nr:DUF1684 domain-containing protein [Nitrososphaerales archaeon]